MKYWLLLFLTALLSSFTSAEEGSAQTSGSAGDFYTDKVVVLKVGEKSLMNKHSFKYWRKVLRQADEQKAKAVVFDLNTPGGYAAETADLITRVMPDLGVKTIAFVNTEATSAGSMIAFGCDKIYMHPRGTIGSTGIVSGTGEIEPVMRAKIESLFQSYVKIVAKEKGRNADVMKAMMFRDHAYEFAEGQVKVKEGELLNLIADEAVLITDGKPLLADGISKDLEGVLKAEGLENVPVINADPKGMEAFASWIGLVSPLLISIGVIALFMEFKAPGFGVFGLVALLAFALFFVGNNLDGNMSGMWIFALFMVGVILLLLELWVIPGTFVAGTIGLVMMVAAVLIAMVDVDMFDSFKDTESGMVSILALIERPILYLGIALGVSIAGSIVVMRCLPSLPMYNALATSGELEAGTGEVDDSYELIGSVGVVTTELRPAGKVEIDGEVHDVVSNSGFVEEGVKVTVVSADAMRILVQPIA